MTDRAATSPAAGSTQFQAFSALVLDDPALQQALRQFAADDAFMASLLDAARRRGFAFAAEDVWAVMRERVLGIDNLVRHDVKQTRLPADGWLPIRASWQGGELFLRWGHFGDRHLREPFFEGDVRNCLAAPFNRAFAYVTPVEALAEWLEARPHLAPSGLIFHWSRCGSTLVSQMLAALPSNIVVAEASPIDSAVQARFWQPELSDERHISWLRSVVGAFGQQRSGGERHYVIKLDCWHALALPLFRRAFPSVPWVFLYRDPVEVMVSQMRMPGAQMLPQALGPDLYGIEWTYGSGGTEDYYARVLRKIGEAVVEPYAAGGGLLVNYAQLPDALFSAIMPHFGLPCSDADRAAMTKAAHYDAKAPGVIFAPDSGTKQQAATPAVRAAADRWLADLYQRLEALRTCG
jgi:hypothetical protein